MLTVIAVITGNQPCSTIHDQTQLKKEPFFIYKKYAHPVRGNIPWGPPERDCLYLWVADICLLSIFDNIFLFFPRPGTGAGPSRRPRGLKDTGAGRRYYTIGS